MLNRIDTFFIKAGTASTFFFIDFERQFPPGLHIHATNSLSRVAQAGPNPASPVNFAIASIVSYSVHLPDGEGPLVYLPLDDQNAISVENCARIRFRLVVGKASAKCLITIYTF
jgi:hypothetical protein